MPRWIYLALFLLGLGVAVAADSPPALSGWYVDSRIILAVAGVMSALFWKLIDSREATLKLQIQTLSEKLDGKFRHIDEKLNSITRLEYEIADVTKLSVKLDVVAARLGAHELDYARTVTKIDGQLHEIFRQSKQE